MGRSIFPSSANVIVTRDRPDDRPCPRCNGRLATLGSSTELHAAALLCTCNKRHLAWLSERTTDAVLCDAAIGERQPISLRQIEEDTMAAQADYDDTNTGALFKNKRKEDGDKRPDFTGTINVNGTEMWLSAWKKKDKDGNGYLSLSVRPKDGEKPRLRSRSATTWTTKSFSNGGPPYV
jgi:hypothetical protein